MKLKSIISWPGNKYRQMDSIISFVNKDKIFTICEPFFGTGAFTMELVPYVEDAVYISESCVPLRNWWHHILNDYSSMIDLMIAYREKFINTTTDRDVFNLLRDGWNDLNKEDPYGIDTAAMFFVLIYASTNNLARFNLKGKYNQTWGKGRNIPDVIEKFDLVMKRRVKSLKSAVDGGCFEDDFRVSMDKFINADGNGRLCYLDPPYIIKTEVYQKGSWGIDEERSMFDYCHEMDNKGISWLMTNYLSCHNKDGIVKHPFIEEVKGNWDVVDIKRGKDARPTNKGLESREVVIIGKCREVLQLPQEASVQLENLE